MKVERGRKKSDLIPERRMEKKKGERAVACLHRGEERERRDPGLVPPSQGRGGIFPTGIDVVVLGALPSTAVVPASF